MTEEEFIENAIKVSMDIGLPYEQAEAIAKLTAFLILRSPNNITFIVSYIVFILVKNRTIVFNKIICAQGVTAVVALTKNEIIIFNQKI